MAAGHDPITQSADNIRTTLIAHLEEDGTDLSSVRETANHKLDLS